MPEIINAIQQRNYELVRDRIANILALELPNQATLNSDTDLDPTIEIERFVPVKDTELPLVNVMLTRGNYDSYTAIQQDGTYMYHIDIYTKAKWSNDDRADKLAFLKLQRLTGVIQAILSDSKYSTLGFAPPSLSRVQVNSLKFADPANNKDASSSVMARIEFEVRVPETVEVTALTLIGGYDTSVLIGNTDQGYVFSGNNAPIPPPTCDPAEVKNTDDTYMDSYPSGQISVIPNTLVILEDTGGNELSNNDLPSANPGGYNLVAPDGNVTVENSDNDTVDSGVVKSGGNIVFNAPDSVDKIYDTANTLLYTVNIPSGDTLPTTIQDGDIQINNTSTFSILAEGFQNINLLDPDGNTIEVDSVSGDDVTLHANSTKTDELIIIVDTTKAGTSASNEFTIPTTTGFGSTYNYDVETSEQTLTDQTGDVTLTWASGGVKEVKITGKFDKCYFNNGGDKLKLLEIKYWGKYGEFQPDQQRAFYGCENNTSIADDVKYLNLLTDGVAMFRDNSLTSLPSGMELPLLTNGASMFFKNSLTSLPSGMELPMLTDGALMFRDNSLTSLPSGMELPMLTDGVAMFLGSIINTTRYSQLLIDMEAYNPNNNVTFHGGNSKYNTAGETAKNALVARGWIITDGGLE